MAGSTALAVPGARGTVTTLPPLRSTVRVRWPLSGAERLDVGADRLGGRQAVQGEERDEGVLGRWAEPGGDQERTYLVAVEAGRVALVVQAGAAYMDRWRSANQALLFGIALEPGDGAEPAGHGRPGTPSLFQGPGVQLDVRPAH